MSTDIGPNGSPVHERAAQWRYEAKVLRAHGLEDRAETNERHAQEMERAFRDWWQQKLSIPEAKKWSGYSAERLRALVREGRIPDRRPNGSQGEIQIRRGDLPRKPGRADGELLPNGGPAENPIASRSQMVRSVVDSD